MFKIRGPEADEDARRRFNAIITQRLDGNPILTTQIWASPRCPKFCVWPQIPQIPPHCPVRSIFDHTTDNLTTATIAITGSCDPYYLGKYRGIRALASND